MCVKLLLSNIQVFITFHFSSAICEQGEEVDLAINMYKNARQYDPMIRLVAHHRKDNLAQVSHVIRRGGSNL